MYYYKIHVILILWERDIQRIRESDEDFEVTSNEIRCKGHCNSKSQGLNEAICGRTYGIIDDI